MKTAAKVRDLEFQYLAEGKGASVTARFLMVVSRLSRRGKVGHPSAMNNQRSAIADWSPEEIDLGRIQSSHEH